MSEPGLELLASCVQANVDNAAAVTNALLAGKDDELAMLAKAYADLWDALSSLPDTVRTVHLERLLILGGPTRDHVDQILNEGTR